MCYPGTSEPSNRKRKEKRTADLQDVRDDLRYWEIDFDTVEKGDFLGIDLHTDEQALKETGGFGLCKVVCDTLTVLFVLVR
jgi:hypothetical protein